MKKLTVGQRRKRRKFILIVVAVICAILAAGTGVAKVSAAPLVSRSQAIEIQMILVHHGYVGVHVDGDYGPITEKAVRQWQKANGLFVDGIPGPVTMGSLRASINGPAEASVAPAKRLKPPKPVDIGLNGLEFAPEGLDSCQEMVFYRIQWDLPDVFDQLGFRESRCRNDVTSSTGCCVGFLQNFITSHLSKRSLYRNRIINECQVNSKGDILGNLPLQKQKQMCVTKVVYDISGLSPWSL